MSEGLQVSIWPPIILILLMAIDFGVTLAKAGELKGKHNPLITLVGMAITGSLLYWGGFFVPLLR
jgi:hypothetical protein